MNRSLAAGVLLLAACGSTNALPTAGSSGGGSSSGSSSSSGSVPDGGNERLDGGADGSLGDGGGGDAGQMGTPGVCGQSFAVGTPTKIALSTAAAETGLTVTGDELSIAWVVESGVTYTLHYADRASAADAFSNERTLVGAWAGRPVFLDDGLSLIVLSADERAFSWVTRPTRSDAFALSPTTKFDNVNETGDRLGDPVTLGSALYYSRFSNGVMYTIVAGGAVLPNDPYSPGQPVSHPDLAAVGGQYRRMSGVSRDSRTLFYWDEPTSKTRALFRDQMSNVLGTRDVGAMRDFHVSADCATAYFTEDNDLYSAPLQ